MSGSWISIKNTDGADFGGYLSKPSSGSGPGILLIQEIFGVNDSIRRVADYYAEEGYVVLAPDLFWRIKERVELDYSTDGMKAALAFYQKFDEENALEDIALSVKALRKINECVGKVGALGFCLGGKMVFLAAERSYIDCGVSYYGVGIEKSLHMLKNIKCPLALHYGGSDEHISIEAIKKIKDTVAYIQSVEFYEYPDAGHGFANSDRNEFSKSDSLMAHSRSIALFRKEMGPYFNLSELWDKHCEYEFMTRNVEATMDTMVPQPYVNHIPTMTGGVGYNDLKRFYTEHFIFANPKDTKLIPISRTIGSDRVVDELLFCFTHDKEIDWMLPGVKATGHYVEIPLVAIVCFRGGKLYNEHIYWDQASVLVQIGLLDKKGLPVAGRETANKLLNETLPSNKLMKNWRSE
tara:strand:- start:61230 stop:62453 length:1224 start_codon:yes stop_codon:yes gene_type:complete